MLLDFTKISEEEVTYEVLPEGSYTVTVDKVEEKRSERTGNLYWSIQYKTDDDAIIFDNLVFTDKTLNRVKKLFHLLGLDVSGEFNYEPSDLVGRGMVASVLIEEYTDRNGNDKKKNSIDLWRCTESTEEIPF